MRELRDLRSIQFDADHDYYLSDFSDCDLRGVNFSGEDLRHTKFDWSDLRGALFVECDLSGEVSFAFANLDGADFTNAILNLVAFEFANIEAAIFDEGLLAEIKELYGK
ncbi:pentapeptide repeat-containing protein [Pedobacter sp. P351]|uniref:pentapeptide repeat-containing protein n=1 Tax=Pedobacter superstes TaxID=3133441 RepID=UPI0030A007CC